MIRGALVAAAGEVDGAALRIGGTTVSELVKMMKSIRVR